MEFQHTIGETVYFRGIGLHTGREANISIAPAPPNSGIVFNRAFKDGIEPIHVAPESLSSSRRCTAFSSGDVSVMTVEHLMAALWGADIDNAVISIDSDEVPMGDGSALEFLRLLKKAGKVNQGVERDVIAISEPIMIKEGDAKIAALPSDRFKVTYTFVSEHPVIGTQTAVFDPDPGSLADSFEREIAPARTVGFFWEIEELRKNGRALGGSLDTAVIVDESGYLGELRFEDEIARHKILDLLGDLFMIGRVRGHFVAERSGHLHNHMLAARIKSLYGNPAAGRGLAASQIAAAKVKNFKT